VDIFQYESLKSSKARYGKGRIALVPKHHIMDGNCDYEMVFDGSSAYALTGFFPVKGCLVLQSTRQA
jgi:hypothetical protein